MHKIRPMGLALVKFDERFLEPSWHWLNDPEARSLNRAPAFTREEQRVWFDSLENRKDYFIWGIELKGVPIGALGFKHVERESAECWCYIGEKSLWGRGIGSWIGRELIENARRMNLKKVSARISKHNKRVVRLCKVYGFVEVSSDETTLQMEKSL